MVETSAIVIQRTNETELDRTLAPLIGDWLSDRARDQPHDLAMIDLATGRHTTY